MASTVGFEPTTVRFGSEHSIQLSYAEIFEKVSDNIDN